MVVDIVVRCLVVMTGARNELIEVMGHAWDVITPAQGVGPLTQTGRQGTLLPEHPFLCSSNPSSSPTPSQRRPALNRANPQVI